MSKENIIFFGSYTTHLPHVYSHTFKIKPNPLCRSMEEVSFRAKAAHSSPSLLKPHLFGHIGPTATRCRNADQRWKIKQYLLFLHPSKYFKKTWREHVMIVYIPIRKVKLCSLRQSINSNGAWLQAWRGPVKKPVSSKKTQTSEATFYLQTFGCQRQMFEHLGTFNWSL